MTSESAVLPDIPLTPFISDILSRIDASAGSVKEAVSLPAECYT